MDKKTNKNKKSLNSSTNNNKEKDSIENKKKILKSQIKDLQNLISQTENSLDIAKFGAVKNSCQVVENVPERRKNAKIPNLFVQFSNDLCKYAGFYCVKLTKTEYIFNFTAVNDDEKNETFAVQIFNNNGKTILGNWVMPTSSDIKKIIDDTPITSPSSIIPFLRNCKQHVDCYGKRKSEFRELTKHIADLCNVRADANTGFSLITVKLFEVYDKLKGLFVNLTIYLSYKSNETRPSVVNVEWNLPKKPTTAEDNGMNNYVKYFKNHNLVESFKKIVETNHPIFAWAVEKSISDELRLDSSSDSEDESFLKKAKIRRERILAKRRKNRELRERWKKRQRESTLSRNRKYSSDEESSNPPELPVPEISVELQKREKKTKEKKISYSEEAKKKSLGKKVEKSLEKKSGRVLRQTTLSFQKNSLKESPIVKFKKPRPLKKLEIVKKPEVGKPLETRTKNLPKKREFPVTILSGKGNRKQRSNFAMTSTPLQKKSQNRVKFLPLNETQLSPILSGD